MRQIAIASTWNTSRLLLLAILITTCLTLTPANSTDTNYQSSKDMTTAKYCLLEPGVVLHDKCQDGAKLIDKMLIAASNLNDYSADYKMLVHKEKQLIQETGTMYFRKPKLFRVEVKEGPKKGALAILCSDGKVHGHLGGMMKYFQSAVSPDSSLVQAINGYPMVGSDFYSLADYLKNMLKHGDISLSTNEPIQTIKVSSNIYVLDMYNLKSSKNQEEKTPLLLKRIYVDPKTYLPLYWEDYSSGKLWSESSWTNLRNNLALPNNLFNP